MKKVVSYLKQCHNFDSTKNHLKVATNKFKLLQVIGEDIGQVFVEKTVVIEAIKIDRVVAELKEFHDVLFKNKVVKQGVIHVQIFYVNLNNAVMHTATDIPFTLIAEIPNFEPDSKTEVQNHLLDITPKHRLIQSKCHDGAILEIKVVAHFLTVVSEWVQRDLVTKIEQFPSTNNVIFPTCSCH